MYEISYKNDMNYIVLFETEWYRFATILHICCRKMTI